MKNRIAAAASVVLVLPMFLLTTSTSARADGETCDGKPATMVVTDAPPTTVPTTPVKGTDGDDVIVVTYSGFVLVDGGAGNDTICGGANTYVSGGDGNDDLWSGAVRGAGDGVMDGGNGSDVLHGDGADEHLDGAGGDDTIYGAGGNDVIRGDAGDLLTDPISPPTDVDAIDAGPGDDVVVDGWGNDSLLGGPGRDTLVLGVGPVNPDDDCPWSNVAPTLDARAGTVTGLGNDTFSGFRVYRGGSGHNTLLGSDGPDSFKTGYCGSATIDGRGGNDHIFEYAASGSVSGGSGDDHILVAASDPVRAGPGADRVKVDRARHSSVKGVLLDGGPGRDRLVERSGRYDRIDLRHGLAVSGVWRVRVKAFEDATEWRPRRGAHTRSFVLLGTSGPNLLRVTRRAPQTSPPAIIRGLGGGDTLLGRHRDTAYGGPGRDLCRAGHTRSCERT